MKQLLCYGDSNTWGLIPGTKERYPGGVRWTSILQEKFGTSDVHVIEEGLCGRTTVFDDKGRIIKGMIIRHLMLPGLLFDSKKVIDTIYKTFGDNVYVSIMNQYIPMFNACNYPEINKRLFKVFYIFWRKPYYNST